MTIKLTDHEERIFVEARADILESPPEHYFSRRRSSVSAEELDELRKLYCEGKAFYITGSVCAPYDGCFHEPNIWLCTPPGCEEFDNCNATEHAREDGQPFILWPLYASGQGVGTDLIWNFADLVYLVWEESLIGTIYSQDERTSSLYAKINRLSPSGRIDCFEFRPMGTINDLVVNEHYWGQALHAAYDEYGLCLVWECDKCETVGPYDEYDFHPSFTGSRGNGGIGVFMDGAFCDDCIREGIPMCCEGNGGDPSENYNPEVAEGGYSLCEWHAEEVLKGHLVGKDGAVDCQKPAFLKYDERGWLAIFQDPDNEGEKRCDIKVGPEVEFKLEALHIDDLEYHFEPGSCGLQLDSNWIDNWLEEPA